MIWTVKLHKQRFCAALFVLAITLAIFQPCPPFAIAEQVQTVEVGEQNPAPHDSTRPTGLSAQREANLKSVHPDESADYTFNERLSCKHSLESLNIIKSALDSFRKLTEAAANKISKERLSEIGNTGWEMQNLGFANHVEAVKGTIVKQEYLIKKLTYELTQRRVKSGEMGQKDLLDAKMEYEKAHKQFQEFWNTFGIAD